MIVTSDAAANISLHPAIYVNLMLWAIPFIPTLMNEGLFIQIDESISFRLWFRDESTCLTMLWVLNTAYLQDLPPPWHDDDGTAWMKVVGELTNVWLSKFWITSFVCRMSAQYAYSGQSLSPEGHWESRQRREQLSLLLDGNGKNVSSILLSE